MTMCKVGRVANRFGRTPLFGRSSGRKMMIITTFMCRGLLSSRFSDALRSRGLAVVLGWVATHLIGP